MDTELELVCDSESDIEKNEEQAPEDQQNVATMYKEPLSNDVKQELLLQGGHNLDNSADFRILEKNDNEGILKCPEHEEGIEKNPEGLNFLKQKIRDIKMINIGDHTRNFAEAVEEMKSVTERALTAGITKVMEYQERLGEALEDIKSMKEKALSARTTIALEYQKRLDEALEKINIQKEKLSKHRIMDAEVVKMEEHQEPVGEITASIKTEDKGVVPSASDSMKNTTKKRVVRNPFGILDSKIEKIFFKAHGYIDKCKKDPDISKTQFWLQKIKIYGSIMALPIVMALCAVVLCTVEGSSCGTLCIVGVGLSALSFIINLYILVKVLKSDLRFEGIYKPRLKDYIRSLRKCIK
ncbi:hypothetical protein C922_05574 [Plasmodium inui San Antonio 1]|uniref:Uncharacterized protein n=1 Tax=Plasmodium inui San Antonio 1 TaxID=1237626 RepID=W6ZXN6_9APIC|nr:hypothetical protein C922_05574 [Plasmodium inui San Antonio 1]EUD64048.1 hypothetical protein C922_05574 [Plasmodium inui San Antonio 1]